MTKTARAKTENFFRSTNKYRLTLQLAPEDESLLEGRPKTRGDCAGIERPCPYVGCKYNTYLDVDNPWSLRHNFFGKDPDEVDPVTSCSLDLADNGGMTFDEIAKVYGVSRQRIEQISNKAIKKMSLFGWLQR